MEKRKYTPSEFYKIRRPEYFSDSDINYEFELPKEVLALELKNITKNQKENEFELLCRQFSEKLITPNLIPQVGPTGGGDGKTDTETYPVSDSISDRWFVPENGWSKDEKWAFAFSAKEDWKSKVRSDVKNILSTKREYTKIYFISNQLIRSKDRKEIQDKLISEFNIEITILDGEWILEKTFSNNLIGLVVKALNSSEVYKKKSTRLGPKDAQRIQRLDELEAGINNPNRYFEYDFQLVEDALESAILSRMLEKSKDEVEGKFDRALRFCKKVNNDKQFLRIHYQRAWTYINWYDDYSGFLEEYKIVKKHITPSSNIAEVELLGNLYFVLNSLTTVGNITQDSVCVKEERKFLFDLLGIFTNDKDKPCAALIAKSRMILLELVENMKDGAKVSSLLSNIGDILEKSQGYLDYPFESFQSCIEELGNILHDERNFDELIDKIALISEKRNSKSAAGIIFLRRGGQKLQNNNYRDGIVYLGKAILKLSKEETKYGMFLALRGLGYSYNHLGLIWASNNCYISAAAISFKSWFETGTFNSQMMQCVKELAFNELILGRIPSFLVWHELYLILSGQIGKDAEESEGMPTDGLMDACLTNRLLNSNFNLLSQQEYLPDLLEKRNLWISQDAFLYMLGYTKEILDNAKEAFSDESSLDEFYSLAFSQPCSEQMFYDTNFMSETEIQLTSIIMGCEFIISCSNHIEMLLFAETLLAFLEAFFSTSFKGILPKNEVINIKILQSNVGNLEFKVNELYTCYDITNKDFELRNEERSEVYDFMIRFVSHVAVYSFYVSEPLEYFKKLFEQEEIHERVNIIFNHRNFLFNILGQSPKYFMDDWIDVSKFREFPCKREKPPVFEKKEFKNTHSQEKAINIENVRHDKRKIYSVVNIQLWDKAQWKGIGFMLHPSYGLGLLIGFNEGDAGRKIFDEWIECFGNEDQQEEISIVITKGVNREHPHWYRVIISSNVDGEIDDSSENRMLQVVSRIHEMNPENSNNLDNFMKVYSQLNKYKLYPARIDDDGRNIEPFLDKGILKKKITVRDAWEIGENDFEAVVIKENDNPIIPDHVEDAPVLKVLNKKREKTNESKTNSN